MDCRNLCERLYSKIIFGKSHYEGGRKYCRRCEVYFYHDWVFCPYCGMALRMSPTNKRDKERLRQLRLRREDTINRIIMGIRNANQTKNFTTTGQILSIIRDESLHQRLYVDNYLKSSQQNDLECHQISVTNSNSNT